MTPQSATKSSPMIGTSCTLTGGVFVRLPDDYLDRAHEIGKLRVVQGGYRTAEFLKGLHE